MRDSLLDDLDGLDVVAPAEEMGSYVGYRMLLHSHGVNIHRQITANSSEVMVQMVKKGLGYSYMAVGTIEAWQNENGNPAVGCARIPGLPTERICSWAYLSDNPNVELICRLGALLQREMYNL